MTIKQITAAPKRYCVEVTGNGDVGTTANLADFTLDEAAARDILKLAGMAREMKLSRLERFDYSASFSREQPGTPEAEALGEENDVRVDCTSLVVTGTDFYFRSYEKHTGNPMSCAHQSLNELASHFGIDQSGSAEAQEPLLQWHVVCNSPKQDHRRVAVGVDQTRYKRMLGQLNDVRRKHGSTRLCAGQNRHYFAVFDGHRMLFQDETFRYDWNDPFRM